MKKKINKNKQKSTKINNAHRRGIPVKPTTAWMGRIDRGLDILLSDLAWRRQIRGLQFELAIASEDLKVTHKMPDGSQRGEIAIALGKKIGTLNDKISELKSMSDKKILATFKNKIG